MSSPTLRTIAQPREQKIRPQSGYHGQFSAPFAVAAALLGGGGLGLWLDDFSDDNARDIANAMSIDLTMSVTGAFDLAGKPERQRNRSGRRTPNPAASRIIDR